MNLFTAGFNLVNKVLLMILGEAACHVFAQDVIYG